MSNQLWHQGWSGMKGAFERGRKWMTWAEFDGLLRQCGVSLTPYHVCRALAGNPPEKVAGGKRYTNDHLPMVAAYVERRSGNA
jgi:hypothetical protein